MMSDASGKRSSPVLIAAAWLVVLVPTGWGLTYTVQNALKIFSTGATPPASTPAAAPAAK